MKDCEIKFNKDNKEIKGNKYESKEILKYEKELKDFISNNKLNITDQNIEHTNKIILKDSNDTEDDQSLTLSEENISTQENQNKTLLDDFNEDNNLEGNSFLLSNQDNKNSYDTNAKSFVDSKSTGKTNISSYTENYLEKK
jgi:hypothetical protein